MNPEELAKRMLPGTVKDGVEHVVRATGVVTAGFRPPPDFMIIGTKRGGTTSLWQSLLNHPQVMPMVPAAKNLKSPAYFFAEYGRGTRWYLGHFPTRRARRHHASRHGNSVVGEASPGYLWDPRVPQRAAAVAPRAKIVILLRDPVNRAFSHWQERTKQGIESLSFDEALAAEQGRLAGELARMATDPTYYSRAHDWYSYRSRGVYVDQVARWEAVYPRDQLLVCRSEDFYADGAEVLGQVTRFLGLDPVQARLVRRNTSLDHRSRLTAATERTLRSYFGPYNAQLARLLQRDFHWPE